MTIAYKSLGQANPGASITDLYTVPASTEAIAFVTATNVGSTARTIRIMHAPAGAADDPDHRVVFDFSVPPNDPYVHPKPLYMAATDKIRVFASSTEITFTVDGIEVS